MRIDEIYFFRIESGRMARLWGLEDTWTRRRARGRGCTLGRTRLIELKAAYSISRRDRLR
jgi:hypothetical protein